MSPCRMDLMDYLRESKWSTSELARRVGVARSHMQHLKAGRRHPSAALIDRITEATAGMVTHHDWSARRALNPRPWKRD